MRTVIAAAALGSVLLLGASADRAAAMPSPTPSQLGLATADTGLVQKTAVICGRWGCRRVLRGARVWSGPRRRLYAFAGPRSSLAWSDLVGVGLAVLLGVGPPGAVRGGAGTAGKLIAMTAGA